MLILKEYSIFAFNFDLLIFVEGIVNKTLIDLILHNIYSKIFNHHHLKVAPDTY